MLTQTLASITLFTAVSLVQPGTAIPHTEPSPIRDVEQYDISKKGLALDGYDPVAYFPEGGKKATKGKKSLSVTHKGVTYRFASEANKERFEANPARYEPAYGGWCAWAMAKGSQTESNPKSFIVKDGRLFVFYDGLFGDTRKDWLKGDHASLASDADSNWEGMSGESPRVPSEAP